MKQFISRTFKLDLPECVSYDKESSKSVQFFLRCLSTLNSSDARSQRRVRGGSNNVGQSLTPADKKFTQTHSSKSIFMGSYLLRCSCNQVKLLDIGVATSYFDFLEAGVQEGTHNKK